MTVRDSEPKNGGVVRFNIETLGILLSNLSTYVVASVPFRLLLCFISTKILLRKMPYQLQCQQLQMPHACTKDLRSDFARMLQSLWLGLLTVNKFPILLPDSSGRGRHAASRGASGQGHGGGAHCSPGAPDGQQGERGTSETQEK